MRLLLGLAALALTAAPALADTPGARRGTMLRDSQSARVGQVQEVSADGSVKVILNSRLITVPASSLSMVDGKLTTSMTKKELSAR